MKGCSDSGSGARGCSSGARGCNSGARGCNSGAVGCYSGGGMTGCVMVEGGLVGCDNDGDLLAQQMTAFVLLPFTIVLSTMYVLSLMVAISVAITMSFMIPFILIGYAIYIGSVIILVIGVVAALVLAAIWMKDAMKPEEGRSSYSSHLGGDEEGSEESEVEEQCWRPSGIQRIQLLFVGLAVLVGVFLILCLTTYGQLVAVMPPETNITIPEVTFNSRTTTTLMQQEKIPGSNRWSWCSGQTHTCYSKAWCCCDMGFTWDGWTCT